MTDVTDQVRNGNIYVYKLTCDNGGAPCIHEGLLSLSICKPGIRVSANVGDWIIGFGGKSVEELRGKLIYVAKVTAIEEDGNYYKSDRYGDRPDCVYQSLDHGYQYREGKQYHFPGEFDHDLGRCPEFERARCLLSDQFAYFGGAKDRPSIDAVRDIYDGLPRDFRKNHPDEIRHRLESYIFSVFAFKTGGDVGSPTHRDTSMKCYDIEDEVVTFGRCSR